VLLLEFHWKTDYTLINFNVFKRTKDGFSTYYLVSITIPNICKCGMQNLNTLMLMLQVNFTLIYDCLIDELKLKKVKTY